jgi:cell division protein FtsQ
VSTPVEREPKGAPSQWTQERGAGDERGATTERGGSERPEATAGDGNEPGEGRAEANARRTAGKWRTAFFTLAAVGIVGVVAWALLGSKLFVVRSVTVTGTHLVSSSEVSGAADVPLGTPLSRVDPGMVAQRVEGIRQIASATVTKSWPDAVTITVHERVPVVAVRMAGGGFDLVDHTGVIVRWSSSKPSGLPILLTTASGASLREDKGVASAAAVLGELPAWLSKSVGSVSNSGPVTLTLNDSKTVVWGGTDRAAVKARELAILMREPARYYDVSAPGTAITR